MSAARYLTIRSLPPPAVCLAALALLAGALPARADPLPLPDGERLSPPWEGMLFLAPDSGVRAERAATFRVTDAPEVGRALVVGPWLAGEWSARAELRTPLPARSTDFTGLYRTVDLLPFTAVVRVEEYGAAGKRVGTVSYPLAPAKEWTEFRVRLDKFPPGTESLRAAFGLAQHTEGQAWFARLEARPAGAHPLAEMEAPRLTRPAPPAPQKGTGFYRVHLSGDTWWLLDPDGRPCWSRATDPPAAPLEPEEYVEQVRGWGFNGLAGWHSLRRYGDGNRAAIAAGQAPMPQFAVLNFHDARRFGQYDMLTDGHGRRKDGEHGFPDPFDPRFVEAAGKLARDRAALVRNAPWFVAWFVDNEIDYSDLYRYVWSRHCGEAFVAFLQRKYPEIKTLNRRWDTKLPDYAALAAKKPVPPLMAGRMYEDFLAFERVLAKRYVDVTVDAARTADANHLVASNRHMLSGLTEWLRHVDLCSAYDIVAVNLYPDNQHPGVGPNGLAVLREVGRRSGRPVLIGEWSVPALDSGLYAGKKAKLDWSFPQAVPTQAIRARQAARILADFYNEPYIIGAHWFIYGDYDTPQREANRGLVRSDGRPWEELVAALAGVHRQMDEHLGK